MRDVHLDRYERDCPGDFPTETLQRARRIRQRFREDAGRRHRWLYFNTLDHVATVLKLVAFYVEQHSQCLPHSAFQGQTPDEMYSGTGADIPKRLATARIEARQSHLAANRALNCQNCSEPDSISN
jgi:hypothetical protein